MLGEPEVADCIGTGFSQAWWGSCSDEILHKPCAGSGLTESPCGWGGSQEVPPLAEELLVTDSW